MKASIDIATSLFKQKKYQEVIEICNQILSNDPNSIEALKFLAKTFFTTKQIETARKYLVHILSIEPENYEIIKEIGNTYQATNNPAKAKDFYQKALLIKDNYAPALTNLGAIQIKLGKRNEGLSLLIKATESDPNLVQAWANLVNYYINFNKTTEAEIACNNAIRINPNIFHYHYLLYSVLTAQNKSSEAETSIRKAIKLNPNLAEAHANLGNLLQARGQLKEAEISTHKAIKLNPNLAEAHANLGNLLQARGQLKEAEISTHKAIKLNPNLAEAHANLGNLLQARGQLKEAEISTRKAIELNPNFAESYSNLGNILCELGSIKEAEISLRKAIKLNPKSSRSHLNLGSILRENGKLKEAEISTRKAIDLENNLSQAYSNLGVILIDKGDLQGAEEQLNKSLKIKPEENHNTLYLLSIFLKQYSWDKIETLIPYLKHLGLEGKGINPHELMYLEDKPENHLKRAVNYSKNHNKERIEKLDFYKKSTINIGYFSSDFKDHPVSVSLTRVLELHDSTKFKIYAYSLGKNNDDYTKRIKNAVYRFREVNTLSDSEVVKIVRQDQIDIAVDLNGFTKGNRKSIFYYRPAPIQINYLGYPGSLGSQSYDYILADRVLIPEENKKFYTEEVLYLPNSSIPYDSTSKASNKAFKKIELNLPSDRFIFTCFNKIQKITRKEFTIWIRLLQRVEKSVLWLIKPNQFAINNIYNELSMHGIDKERIIFAERMNLNDHLSRHSSADLFLDTFNYNAATTAKIALTSGLPIITRLGKSYSARMAASILSACDLTELITHTDLEYESLAYELATNKKKLSTIKEKIRVKMNCQFFNSEYFTNNLEKVYTNIIKKK